MPQFQVNMHAKYFQVKSRKGTIRACVNALETRKIFSSKHEIFVLI